jgi:hypothetical protein
MINTQIDIRKINIMLKKYYLSNLKIFKVEDDFSIFEINKNFYIL